METAFTMIADYCFENMIDEPKVSGMTKIGNTLVLYGDGVTFEIEYYYEVETEIGNIDTEKGPKKPIMLQTKDEFSEVTDSRP